jgi:hypothetical protein
MMPFSRTDSFRHLTQQEEKDPLNGSSPSPETSREQRKNKEKEAFLPQYYISILSLF